jgi:hypothetical protein
MPLMVRKMSFSPPTAATLPSSLIRYLQHTFLEEVG